MNQSLERKIYRIAQEEIDNDPSHDLMHAERVMTNAKRIARREGGDLDILIPAALFHDLIVYQKGTDMSKNEQEESAMRTRKLLEDLKEFPDEKIDYVCNAIKKCSFSKGITPERLEAKILQDADGLEATGVVSVMRTFASVGKMNIKFYNPQEPIPEGRDPDPTKYGFDLFFTRLLKVKDEMHTETAKELAEERTTFLKDFIEEFKNEIEDYNP